MLGLPRSGTHYLRWLIERNFDALTHKHLGWEHALPHDRWQGYATRMNGTVLEATAGLTRLVIYKDRARWLASLDRNPPAARQVADYLGPSADRVYSEFMAGWAPHAHLIRYESFIVDFPSALDYLGTLIGQQPLAYVAPEQVPESPDWMPAHRERYL